MAGPTQLGIPRTPKAAWARHAAVLAALSGILFWITGHWGGVMWMYRPLPWLALGLLGAAAAWAVRRAAPWLRLEPPVGWLLLLLPAWVVFQMLPLPAWLVQALSPARGAVMEALAKVGIRQSLSTLSVQPSTTLEYFLLLCGYLIVFLLVREASGFFRERAWVMPLPLVAVAVWQALLGINQYFAAHPSEGAHGSYANRNHFAGLLEMALPLACVWPLLLDANRCRPEARAAAKAAGWSAAALLLAGVAYSLSRMGFLSALWGLAVMGGLAAWSGLGERWQAVGRRAKWGAAAAVALGAVTLFFLLPPGLLIGRFAALTSSGEITPDHRLALLRDTPRLIAAFPLFGCGLGNFEAAYPKYKRSDPFFTDDYAHNDYLQLTAELGAAGALILLLLAATVLRASWRLALRSERPAGRWLGAGCCGALGALLLHSLADYNLYIPANAMAAAWIGGVAAGTAAGMETGSSEILVRQSASRRSTSE